MTTINVQSFQIKTANSTGKQYGELYDSTGKKYLVWANNLGRLRTLKAGDVVDADVEPTKDGKGMIVNRFNTAGSGNPMATQSAGGGLPSAETPQTSGTQSPLGTRIEMQAMYKVAGAMGVKDTAGVSKTAKELWQQFNKDVEEVRSVATTDPTL